MTAQESLYIFAGPSIEKEAVEQALPHAVILPPVAQGQIADIVSHNDAATILIIDGFFYQDLSVMHKEIILALQQGVTVVGCSSMGALRAAELHPFGMLGIGSVFEYYRDNFISGDDEVAVLHEPSAPFKNLTIPVINLRIFIEKEQDRPGFPFSRDEAALILDALVGMPFTRRTYEALESALQGHLTESRLHQVMASIRQDVPDYKRRDAMQALELLSSGMELNSSASEAAGVAPGYALDALLSAELHYAGGFPDVPPGMLWAAEAFTNEEFPSRLADAVYRNAAIHFAESQGLEATDANLALVTKDLMARYDCADAGALRAVLGLDRSSFDAFLRDEALLYALRYAHVYQNFLDGSIKAYCDALRANGSYAASADRTRSLRGTLSSEQFDPEPTGLETNFSLLKKHFVHLPARISKKFFIRHGFVHVHDFRNAIKRLLALLTNRDEA